MRYRTLRVSILAVAATFIVTGSAFAVSSANNDNGEINATKQCSDVHIVFGRGFGEDGAGLGNLGNKFFDSVKSKLNTSNIDSYGIDDRDGNWTAGALEMVSHVSDYAETCPESRLVIGGYSQGAAETSIAIGFNVFGTSVEKIPDWAAERVSAVVAFGNPLGGSTGGYRTIVGDSPEYGSKAIEMCNFGDWVCGFRGPGAGTHLTYPVDGSVDVAADFVAGRV